MRIYGVAYYSHRVTQFYHTCGEIVSIEHGDPGADLYLHEEMRDAALAQLKADGYEVAAFVDDFPSGREPEDNQ